MPKHQIPTHYLISRDHFLVPNRTAAGGNHARLTENLPLGQTMLKGIIEDV